MLALSRWRQEDQKSVGILRSKPVQGQPGQYETLSQKFKGGREEGEIARLSIAAVLEARIACVYR